MSERTTDAKDGAGAIIGIYAVVAVLLIAGGIWSLIELL